MSGSVFKQKIMSYAVVQREKKKHFGTKRRSYLYDVVGLHNDDSSVCGQ